MGSGSLRYTAKFLLLGILAPFLLVFALPSARALAAEVAVVGSGLKVYEETLEGFRAACDANLIEFRLQDYDSQSLARSILASRPALIVALGHDALEAVGGIKDIPVVALMVPNLRKEAGRWDRVTGVDITLSVEAQLEELTAVLPKARRIGVVYNPEETGYLVREAEAAASARGLTIVGRRASSPKEVVAALDSLRGEIDALWMLPDVTILNYEIIKYMMFFEYEYKVPLYAFSDKYLKNSALVGLGIDAKDIGAQAGEMANRILSGADVARMPVAHARKGELFLNVHTARKLGVELPEEALERANKVFGEDRR
jgi:putative ABC transport system substrate-binding protein